MACFVHLTNAVGDSGHCACPLPCMHHPPKGHTVASTPSDRRNRTKRAIRNKHTKQPGKKNTYSGSPCRSSGNAAVVDAVAAAVVVAVVVVADPPLLPMDVGKSAETKGHVAKRTYTSKWQ